MYVNTVARNPYTIQNSCSTSSTVGLRGCSDISWVFTSLHYKFAAVIRFSILHRLQMNVQKKTIKPEAVEDDPNQIITDFIGIPCPQESEFYNSNSNKMRDSKMKIYKRDGTYEVKSSNSASSFGWMCSDFIVDENIPAFEMKNVCTRFYKSQAGETNATSNISTNMCTSTRISHVGTESSELGNLTKIKATVTDLFKSGKFSRSESLEDSCRTTDSVNEVKQYYEVKPNVKMARILSTQSTIEGPIGPDGKDLKYRLGIDWAKPPSGEELATLLNPYCPKSKVLLSILHNTKYQKVAQEAKNPANITKLIDSRNFKFLPSNETGFEDIVLQEILDYQSSKEDNELSIMTEIILADLKCDIDDVVVKDKSLSATILTDSRNASFISNSRKSSKNFDTSDLSGKGIDDQSRSDLFRSIGLSDTFDRSLQSYSQECQDFRAQLDLIKEAFQHEDDKTQKLIQNIRSLSKEIEEVNTLDDYLHLLEGNLDKVKDKMEAFRIFCHTTEIEESNFII